MEYYSAIKKNEILPFAEWMDLEGIISPSKWNKSDRERQILDDITYMWNLKHNKLVNKTKGKQTHRHREQTSGYQWGEGGGKGHDRGRRLRGTNYYV